MENFDRKNTNLLSGDAEINEIEKIIMKAYKERTSQENETLIDLVRKIKFFKKSPQLVEEVSKIIGQQLNAPGEEFIKYGEYGDQFYIIMSGKVNVNVPNPFIIDWKKHHDIYGTLKAWK